MVNRLSIVCTLFLLSFAASAQKVKYKDLIVLLTSKQYEKAEPFLKRYLKENDDNPNAYLYMGIVFQEKSSKNDPLLQTDILSANVDSALINYDKAYKTITDKELRKNDEYYEAYMRRDLRTGKFVIKLSDVQLDVETRMKNLKEKKERVKQLRNYFDESSAAYLMAQGLYKSLLQKYGSEREFFLRSDDEMIAQLKRLDVVFDSAMQAFEKYKSVSKELGKTGHDQFLSLQEIRDMKRDGSGPADFMKDDLKLWDYKRWALQTISIVEMEINPIREQLISYDIELNKLRSNLQKDSISVKDELRHLDDKIFSNQLKKYDPDPMPLALFAMKMAELEYHSDFILNLPLRDTSDVRLKLQSVQTEMNDLKKLDSLAARLSKRNLNDEEKDYKHFISKAYGTTSVLQNTISATLEYAKRERVKKQVALDAANQSLRWMVVAKDSIPLFTDSNRDLKFKPLLIEPEKFTFGLAFKDTVSATGYFYSITPSRTPEVKAAYPVDQHAFRKRLYPLIKGLATTDPSGNSFIILTYSTQKMNGKFPATMAKIYRADGLSWSNNFSFEMLPTELTLDNETGEISVKLMDADGAAKMVTIDKIGKLKK
ncbi:MAG: hypothetical protein HY015_01910 [Bacteroidetes bacterium]|nr:hypothetical protein [Bacteroidota bacterium]